MRALKRKADILNINLANSLDRLSQNTTAISFNYQIGRGLVLIFIVIRLFDQFIIYEAVFCTFLILVVWNM